MRSGKKKSVIGDPISFRGMAHAPVNEAGVVALFSMVARDLGFYVQEIGTDFPDCIVRRDNGRAWEELAVEFEWDSRSFKDHGHDAAQCDMIVCWHHNWVDCPAEIEVVRLSEEIKRLSSNPIVRTDRPF
jgi:hypothetical protein